MEATIGTATPASGDGSATGFVERLAEKMGLTARGSVIYGEPIERAGVTVVTVAKARWGVGGGAGQPAQGEGGGGGVSVSPIGYIEIKDGSSTFRPIYDPMSVFVMAIGAAFAGLLVLRGLRKLVR